MSLKFNDRISSGMKLKECYIHNFKTHSDILMDQHLLSLPHYGMGTDGTCENCGEHIKKFLIPYNSIGEPAHILCDSCKNKANKFLETLQDGKLFNSCFSKDYP
jgi:hypothetical protein